MRFRCTERRVGRPMAWTRNTPPPQQALRPTGNAEQTLAFSHCLTREGKVHGVLLPPASEHGIASTISRQFSASGPLDLGRSILPWDVGPNLHGKRPGHRRCHWRIHPWGQRPRRGAGQRRVDQPVRVLQPHPPRPANGVAVLLHRLRTPCPHLRRNVRRRLERGVVPSVRVRGCRGSGRVCRPKHGKHLPWEG